MEVLSKTLKSTRQHQHQTCRQSEEPLLTTDYVSFHVGSLITFILQVCGLILRAMLPEPLSAQLFSQTILRASVRMILDEINF